MANPISQTIQDSLYPATPALARTVDSTISSSTEIALHADTTIFQVYAISQDVYLKYGTADVTASNFDRVIPAGAIVEIPRPADCTAINVIERVAGATVIVIEN